MSRMRYTDECEKTLLRVTEIALQHQHEYITIEHLLYALTENEEIRTLLQGLDNVDLDALHIAIKDYIENDPSNIKITNPDYTPEPTSAFQRVAQRAILYCQSSGRETIPSKNILLALLSERESYAAFFMNEAGITRPDVVYAIAYGPIQNHFISVAIIEAENLGFHPNAAVVCRDKGTPVTSDGDLTAFAFLPRLYPEIRKEFGDAVTSLMVVTNKGRIAAVAQLPVNDSCDHFARQMIQAVQAKTAANG